MLSFEVSSPEVQEEERKVPGRDGVLDLSEALTGEPKYENRTLVATFDMEEPSYSKFKRRIREIQNYMHGRVFRIVDDEELDYYYEGRVSVTWKMRNALFYEISISANVYPYKLKTTETVVTAAVDGEAVVICVNERKSVVPIIITDAAFTVTFGDVTVNLGAGQYESPDIKFTEGNNEVTCVGTGTITFVYQEGAL